MTGDYYRAGCIWLMRCKFERKDLQGSPAPYRISAGVDLRLQIFAVYVQNAVLHMECYGISVNMQGAHRVLGNGNTDPTCSLHSFLRPR